MWLVLHSSRETLAKSCGTESGILSPPACMVAPNNCSLTKASLAHSRTLFASSWQLESNALLIACSAGASRKDRAITAEDPNDQNMCAECCELRAASFGIAAATIVCMAGTLAISSILNLRPVLAKFCGGKLRKFTAAEVAGTEENESWKDTGLPKARAVLPASCGLGEGMQRTATDAATSNVATCQCTGLAISHTLLDESCGWSSRPHETACIPGAFDNGWSAATSVPNLHAVFEIFCGVDV